MSVFYRARHTPLTNAKYGLLIGSADILDGLVNVVTLGQFGANFAFRATFKVLEWEHARQTKVREMKS